MTKFIDINRLDYLNPAYVYRKNEFHHLQHINYSFRYMAVDFLVANNISRYISSGRQHNIMVIRLCFKDIWEWHIPEVMNDISDEIRDYILGKNPGHWDCIWMLKMNMENDPPLFFCDVIVFWNHDESGTSRLPDTEFKLSANSNIAEVLTLIPPSQNNSLKTKLRQLCRPCKSYMLLQCKFAHDID